MSRKPAGKIPDWRQVVAALAGADSRRIYAQIVLDTPVDGVGTGLAAARRDRAVAALLAARLVGRRDEGRLVASETVFREALARQTIGRAPGGVRRSLPARPAP